jgi:hypothetical protein
MSPPSSAGFFPKPTLPLRLAGAAAIVGAILWPFSLVLLGAAASTCTPTNCSGDRATLGVAALAPILLALGVLGLELRAPREPGLADLVGDLSIGTSAVLHALAFVLGTVGFVGPGLLLMLIGSTIFGVSGYFNGGRPRMASVLVGVGAGALLFFLIGGAVATEGLGGAGPSLFSLLVFSVGWIWLGADLLLARPLARQVKGPAGR